MNNKYHETCLYCDTEYYVEFENEDDLLMHCPACGEELVEKDEPELDEEWYDDV